MQDARRDLTIGLQSGKHLHHRAASWHTLFEEFDKPMSTHAAVSNPAEYVLNSARQVRYQSDQGVPVHRKHDLDVSTTVSLYHHLRYIALRERSPGQADKFGLIRI